MDYSNSIETMDNTLSGLLQKYKQLYTIVKMHPANQEYNQQYQATVQSLSDLMNSATIFSQTIQTSTDQLNSQLSDLSSRISQEKERQLQLQKRLHSSFNEKNASNELIDDSIAVYYQHRWRNWTYIIGSIFGILYLNHIRTVTNH